MKKISILIITYNSADVIEKCLDSILAYPNPKEIEIVIVDNHSKDTTLEILQKYKEQITLLQNQTNVGFSRAMNQAFRASTAPLVMTFNPDAELYDDTLDQILDCFRKNPVAGMVAGVLTYENLSYSLPHRTMRLFEESVTLHTTVKYLPKGLSYLEKTATVYNCDWVIGTCMTVKRDILPADQLYPENSFLFWEEYDLCQHIKKCAHDILVSKSVRYKHETSTSFKYDPVKLSTAMKLSNAHAYRIKTERYGALVAKMSLVYTIMDRSLFYGILSLKNILSKSINEERQRSILESKVTIFSYTKLLFGGLKSVKRIDQEATIFFNK